MQHDATPPTGPRSGAIMGTDPMELIREGMTVVDANGDKVGKVEDFKMGDPGAATEAGNENQDTGVVGGIARAFVGDEREPDVPGPLRARLQRTGYIKVDSPGFLIETDRYVSAEQVAGIDGDTVRLRVPKDQLVKER